MRYNKKFISLVVSSASIIGGGIFVKSYVQKQELKASWLAYKHDPSTKWDYNWDRRDPASLVHPKHKHTKKILSDSQVSNIVQNDQSKDDSELNKHSSKATRHLFLIRHGQYEINNNESEKKILTLLGREQAEFAGKYLNSLSSSRFKFTKLHHSTLIRAVQTAEIIKSHLSQDVPVHIDSMLCEGLPIPPEPPMGHWKPELFFYEDGVRIEAAFRKYFHRAPNEQIEDSYEIIVCHANVIRYFFCRALQFPPEAWLRFSLGNGSVTHFIIRPDGRVCCRVLGETGFQPVAKMSTT